VAEVAAEAELSLAEEEPPDASVDVVAPAVEALPSAGRCSCVVRAAFEICCVPTRSFELKASRCHLFREHICMTCRALSKGVIRNFLQNVFGMAAGAALVSVNRHGETKG
jgi:hypothetical protein